jgi:hypothetical protein
MLAASAQKKPPTPFRNDRLKSLVFPDSTIVGDESSRLATGIWVAESKDPEKTLVFPIQVRIRCTRYNKECVELSVTLGAVTDMVSVQDIDDATYDIDKWDSHGLTASFGGDSSSRCQRHVLTMDFASGAVSVADIPTRQKGCEAFTETDSYRLVRGMYYVDTSPSNDMDKQRK